jgi:hypothetical protein
MYFKDKNLTSINLVYYFNKYKTLLKKEELNPLSVLEENNEKSFFVISFSHSFNYDTCRIINSVSNNIPAGI